MPHIAWRWTESEKEMLRSLFEQGLIYSRIGEILHRSLNSVKARLRILGLSRIKTPYRFWKTTDITYLSLKYPSSSRGELAMKMGRTPDAISAKTKNLGFPTKLKRHPPPKGGMKIYPGNQVRDCVIDSLSGLNIWEILCHCGNVYRRTAASITRAHREGSAMSCGCLRGRTEPGPDFDKSLYERHH